jgi:hypothetical protein
MFETRKGSAMRKRLLWVGLSLLGLLVLVSLSWTFSRYLHGRGMDAEVANLVGGMIPYGGVSFLVYWALLPLLEDSVSSPFRRKFLPLLIYFGALSIAQTPVVNFTLKQMGLANSLLGEFIGNFFVLGMVLFFAVWWPRKPQNEQDSKPEKK